MNQFFDLYFWLVVISVVVGFVLAVLFRPPIAPARDEPGDTETIVVYVYATELAEARKIIETEFSEWRIVMWEYDTRRRAFIFVLER